MLRIVSLSERSFARDLQPLVDPLALDEDTAAHTENRTGLTPGTFPLITFDKCAFEIRKYEAACVSVITDVCGFG